MAGVAGFEPTMNGSEPFALPLGDTPKRSVRGFDVRQIPLNEVQGVSAQCDEPHNLLYYKWKQNSNQKPMQSKTIILYKQDKMLYNNSCYPPRGIAKR